MFFAADRFEDVMYRFRGDGRVVGGLPGNYHVHVEGIVGVIGELGQAGIS
jgi:hypothetical protein